MPAISPAEVERFGAHGIPEPILDHINGELLSSSFSVIEVDEEELLASTDSPIAKEWLTVRSKMEIVAALYRAAGWRVIYRKSAERVSWIFTASYF